MHTIAQIILIYAYFVDIIEYKNAKNCNKNKYITYYCTSKPIIKLHDYATIKPLN
jgi:hypothetical protein